MTGVNSVKVLKDGVVTLGSGTAKFLTFLMGRDPDGRVSGSERTAGTDVVGKAADAEKAGAAKKEGTGGVALRDDDQAGDAAW